MALRIWLPLNGNLNNYGLSNITITNNGTTVNSAGKIGKCYQFDTNKYIKLMDYAAEFLTYQTFSLSIWFKCTAQNTAHSGSALISSGNWNQSNNLLQFSLGNFSSDHYTKLLVSGSGVWSNGYSYDFYLNRWYNVVLTSGNGKMRAYVNGELIGDTYSAFTPASLEQSWICIGNGTYSQIFHFIGFMNDVRIYDHCLSPLEVKEIAQGLVLHYKLDGFFGGVGENLVINGDARNGLTNWSNWGTATGRQVITIGNKKWFTFKTDANGNYGGFSQDRGIALYKPNTQYTISALMYASASASGRLWVHTRSTEGGANLAQYLTTVTVTTSPAIYNFTFNTGTNASYTINKVNLMIGAINTTSSLDFYISDIKIEEGTKATNWVPCKEETGYDMTKIQDSSGYNHNATSNGNTALTISSDTPCYSGCTSFTSGGRIMTTESSANILPTDMITVNIWFKSSNTANRFISCTEGGGWNFENNGGNIRFPLYITGKGYTHCNSNTSWSSLNNNWHMITGTYDRSYSRIYIDGILDTETASSYPNINIGYNTNTPLCLGAEAQTFASPIAGTYVGSLSDCRIYCTALSAEDILTLYHTSAQVSNLGSLHTFEAVENASNIIFKIDSARGVQVFQDGLSRYTQANCQVTLTDQGYHIYRPPNLTTANDGNTMWGGLKLVNQTSDTIAAYTLPRDNCWNLQQGHTYLFAFHVKGQSSNGTSFVWSNNMGWGGGGVNATPTQIVNDGIPANFNGEKECIYIFTINDSISKTCTSSYSSYTANTTYLSYRHLTFGYGYSSTGELGTDIYLTNFRLYDITNFIGQIKKTGQANFSDFVENSNIAKILKNSEFLMNNLIER